MTTNYTLDLNNWLTQVLADGTNTYLYGTARIAQYDAGGAEYFLADALGSVRQLADSAGGVKLSKVYEPFGGGLNSSGAGATSYGFTGEWTDSYIELVYLRSRYYSPETGRFLTKDVWPGDYIRPSSLNGWNYVEGNPINRTDPSGKWYCQSGLVPLTSECRSWVKNALEELDNSGATGKRLVNFFHVRDQISQIVNDLVCPPLALLNGIKIYFEPIITSELGAQAFTIWPDQIHINSGLSGFSGTRPSTQAVVTFGHEISHLAQGGFLPSLSVQAEVLATIVGYYLEGELGAVHRFDGKFVIDNRLDPWEISDLMIYDGYYLNAYHTRLPYLVWGNDGIARNWLTNWGITLPYPISPDPKPNPDPIPTPPPPSPPPTPAPPGT
ncbi:MAG: RHS repeat-associated core domain-containing protein [Anaerolineales bacterium]